MSMPPRRSSYASVVSGNAQSGAPAMAQPARSGFMSHLATAAPQPTFAASTVPTHHTSTRSSDLSRSHPGALLESWDKPALPSYPGPLGSNDRDDAMDRPDYAGVLPTYLRGSRYIERLQERQRQRRQMQREVKSARSSQPGSLSTSASNMSLHKMVPSHRGMTHEIIERPFPSLDNEVSSLPSRWSNTDKFQGLEVGIDGLDVKFTGPGKAQDEAASIRADRSIPRDAGVYYFEVTVQGKHKEGLVGIGLSSNKCALSKLPGWETESWAYHGDDGYIFCQTPSGKAYGPRYGYMSTIGCGINFRTGCIFFTKDGIHLGTAFHDIRHHALFPSVGMKKPGEHLRVNFGGSPFVFDVDGMVQKERRHVQEQIDATPATHLHPGKSEEILLKDLVEQYLAHEGYVESARAFSHEAQKRENLLHEDAPAETEGDFREDTDAIQRQRIRAAILEGDIDGALLYTQEYYPQVLRENENIDFKLKCRKFVEMIRRCSELSSKGKAPHRGSTSSISRPTGSATNGQNGHQAEFGVFDGEMEIDSHNGTGHEQAGDGMDLDYAQSSNLMNDALMYGQRLQAEFRVDPRREVKQALEDTFALIAYTNAEESSLAPLLREDGRASIAEELNSAILVLQGKSSASAIERLLQQSEVFVGDLTAEGHAAAFVNIGSDYCREPERR
ncbi:hypothetical protein FH972_025184 [Carpinus fangiana]|uniref:B30.2/SPRY domain-containing protein n=1 Tax=Carpinus fangiana TaxID=176857 RepID=A0A5N6L183_9ROSI|nr:hypothetical protein FH972_025184 [Carpinus fangiana]